MMTEKITSGQENQIIDLVRHRLQKLGFSKDEAQEIIKSGGILQNEVEPIFKRLSLQDPRFGPAVSEFEFTVPLDYKHDNQVDSFAERTKLLPTTRYLNESLNSVNFAKATYQLIPGKTYKGTIFPILSRVSSDDCLSFYQKQQALYVGAQGLTLVQSLKPEEFPIGKWTASFDEKKALHKDAYGNHRVPHVSRDSGGGWKFYLSFFEDDWFDDSCLLCVCDLES